MPDHHAHVCRYLLSVILMGMLTPALVSGHQRQSRPAHTPAAHGRPLSQPRPAEPLPALSPETAALGSTTRTRQDTKSALTNADIIDMIKAGLPESTIILAIQKGPANLDTSAQALIQLKKQGATQRILDAILQGQAGTAATEARTANPAQPGRATPPQGELPLGVILVDGAQRIQMMMSTPDTRVSTGGMMRVVNPLKKIRNRNTLTGSRAQLRTTNAYPLFETALAANINPSDHITVVKLTVKSERRELDVGRTTMMVGVTTEIREKDKVPVTIEEIQTNGQIKVYRVKTSSSLPPGEYAVMLSSGFYDFGVDVSQ
ncbi:MAG TPA: hypothetical protein VF611_14380 [Pyrinomonadaceae bacterium]